MLAALALTACGESNPPIAAQSAPRSAAQAAPAMAAPGPSLEEWKSRLADAMADVRKEKNVRDASWLNERPASLIAGVIDDGTRRDGYAEYLCSVLLDHDLFGSTVRVMDVASATRGEWRELGKADCPTRSDVSFTAPPSK